MKKEKRINQEYIEIVHIDPQEMDALKTLGLKISTVIANILRLEETVGVHYHSGDLNRNFPQVPKDMTIRLGGAVWHLCVKSRAEKLERAGYQNVVSDRAISIYLEDAFDEILY